MPELIPGKSRGLEDSGRQWNQHNQAQIKNRVPERQSKARQNIAFSKTQGHIVQKSEESKPPSREPGPRKTIFNLVY